MLKPLAVSMAIGLAALAAPAYSMPYQVTDLGVLASWHDGFHPRSISNSGEVLAWRNFSYGEGTDWVYERPAVWSGGSWLIMPDISGRTGKDWSYFGDGINDLGQVAVTALRTAWDHGAAVDGEEQGFIWDTRTNTVTALNDPQSNNGYGNRSAISAINNQGTVAGAMGSTDTSLFRAMTWSNGTYTDMSAGLMAGNSEAYLINGQGAVAGAIYDTVTDENLALFYRNGASISHFQLPQGNDGLDLMNMNDQGIVVFNVEGACDDNGCDRTGYIWNALTGETWTIPSTSGAPWGSTANGINNLGQVVGQGMDGDQYTDWDSGLLWDPVNGIQSLNELVAPAGPYWIREGYDINDQGVILAIGAYHATPMEGRLFLLTPVPEPETYALLLAGLGLVGFAARRRKQA